MNLPCHTSSSQISYLKIESEIYVCVMKKIHKANSLGTPNKQIHIYQAPYGVNWFNCGQQLIYLKTW